MMKKVLLVLFATASLLFYSCGSKKAPEAPVLEAPEVLNEDAAETVVAEAEAESTVAVESEADAQTQEETETAEDPEQSPVEPEEPAEQIYEEYPPLEEIEEPALIEVSPEELEAQAAAKAEAAEQNENQITEPVEEIEELPPLPAPEQITDDETALTDNEAASTEGETALEPVEPTIEITEEPEAPLEEEKVIIPSRSISLKKGETLNITYPGSGWIYMGSTSEYNNLASRGRKLGTTDTKYTLLAKEAGTQIHHFYKVDNLTGEYIDDYIEVTVLDKKGSSSTVVNAPEYKEAVPKKAETPAKSSATKQKEAQAAAEKEAKAKEAAEAQKATEEKSNAATDSVAKSKATATTSTTKASSTKPAKEEESIIVVDGDDAVVVVGEEETADNDEEQIIDLSGLIDEAQSAIKAKKYGDAYSALSKYLEYSTDGRDQALYLMGQILESDSKFRNIKEAVNTYQTLCDTYPASEYWDMANKRIIYLKRFYINIH